MGAGVGSGAGSGSGSGAGSGSGCGEPERLHRHLSIKSGPHGHQGYPSLHLLQSASLIPQHVRAPGAATQSSQVESQVELVLWTELEKRCSSSSLRTPMVRTDERGSSTLTSPFGCSLLTSSLPSSQLSLAGPLLNSPTSSTIPTAVAHATKMHRGTVTQGLFQIDFWCTLIGLSFSFGLSFGFAFSRSVSGIRCQWAVVVVFRVQRFKFLLCFCLLTRSSSSFLPRSTLNQACVWCLVRLGGYEKYCFFLLSLSFPFFFPFSFRDKHPRRMGCTIHKDAAWRLPFFFSLEGPRRSFQGNVSLSQVENQTPK